MSYLSIPILVTILISFNIFADTSDNQNCNDWLRGNDQIQALEIRRSNNPEPIISAKDVQGKDPLSFLSTRSAWNLSQAGLQRMSRGLHRMENQLYYLGTGILAKEHILADGPGGGGKTFSATVLLRAQLRSMVEHIKILEKSNIEQYQEYENSLKVFLSELHELIKKDSKADPSHRLFNLQMHQMMSEIPILGMIDPFIMVEDGKKKIDYSRSLIAIKNIFAILDEIDKAPVALQMTLLAILNERKALNGNEIIQTMLESVVATTNASLGELIAQARSYEVGGRQALIDRLALKLFYINASTSSQDKFDFLKKSQNAKELMDSALIDLRSLRPLMDQLILPKELIHAATEIIQYMDMQYTLKYNEALEDSPGSHPRFYPPFSGSTRSIVKIIDLWKASYLMRNLINGVRFENIDMQMAAKDLIDLAPILLQGGPEMLGETESQEVIFVITDGFSLRSNRAHKDQTSIGYYNPYSQIFTFKASPNSPLNEKLYFDIKKKQFVTTDNQLIERLGPGPKSGFKTLEEQILSYHNAPASGQLIFQIGNYISELINEAPLRKETKNQLEEIKHFHTHFVSILNDKITELSHNKLTNYKELPNHLATEETYKLKAINLRERLRAAQNSSDTKAYTQLVIETIRTYKEEASHKFLKSETTIDSILETILFGGNLQLYGPPGSGKTMIGQKILESTLEYLNQSEMISTNSIFAEALYKANKEQLGTGQKTLYVKQFHPQSTESDIIGHVDLAALKKGQGYTFNRDQSLSAKNVFFALLDEFEKSPHGVRTACLSILHERSLLVGDETLDLIISAIILTTNSTPSEFMIGQGAFSTAFPIHDRIHTKAYSFNKLGFDDTVKILERSYFKKPITLETPLPLLELKNLVKKVKIPDDILISIMLPTDQEFLTESVRRSEGEREYHNSDPQRFWDYYINTRGESYRSSQSIFQKELPAKLVLQRILDNKNSPEKAAEKLTQSSHIRFSMLDLIIFANCYLTKNFAYQIDYEYPNNGYILFTVKESSVADLDGRINLREKRFLEQAKKEAELFVSILNAKVSDYFKINHSLIAKFPNLFPHSFANDKQRIEWLKSMGYDDNLINTLN